MVIKFVLVPKPIPARRADKERKQPLTLTFSLKDTLSSIPDPFGSVLEQDTAPKAEV